MTYRERREARADRREEWADKRRKKSAAAFDSSARLANNIPLGQPILVGHHSEKHARRDQERIQSGMSRGVEHGKMAKHHDQAATTIRRQLDTSIYSDDIDASERLRERLEELESERERMKFVNKWFQTNKKSFGFKSLSVGWDDSSEETSLTWNDCSHETAVHAIKIIKASKRECHLTPNEMNKLMDALRFNRRLGFPSYALSNLSGNISRTRKRLQELVGE